ncbi:MAG: arsenite efflux transporter metallochaperone ArsD [Verrucomicrobiales bacterium]|nr:arsenite efflux transporter metallochaperone ArsD [Verrucomicrobiales bacterium]
MRIEVFDPVLCCSSGVCGPLVDPALLRIAADLRWLQENGGQVHRFNLGQNPAAFVQNEQVRQELNLRGEGVLPLVLVDGRIVLRGRYPRREELSAWLVKTPSATTAQGSSDSCECQGSC